jgi:hypothetical protein
MIYAGIDPGQKGAICAYGLDSGPSEVFDIPLCQDGRKTMQLDVLAFCRWLHKHAPSRVIIERQGPMPSDGVIPAFRLGLVYGQLRAVCAVVGIPTTLVSPITWKKWYAIGPDKEQGRQLALKLYPQCAEVLRRKMDHNRAESVLIASWGASHWRGLEAGTV